MEPSNVTPLRRTSERILDAALHSFAGRGYDATSLDALAAGIGVRKQTILHYFRSKDGLLDAVLERAANELGDEIDRALETPGRGWRRVDAVVRAIFRLAGTRPELVGFVREVGRLGDPFTEHLVQAMDPLLQRASQFLEMEMEAGRMIPCDARHVLFLAYAAVIGAATEVEVLRGLGVTPTARLLVRRRRELMGQLEFQLLPNNGVRSVVGARRGRDATAR